MQAARRNVRVMVRSVRGAPRPHFMEMMYPSGTLPVHKQRRVFFLDQVGPVEVRYAIEASYLHLVSSPPTIYVVSLAYASRLVTNWWGSFLLVIST